MLKKLILSVAMFMSMLAIPAVAEEAFDVADFHPLEGKFDVVMVTGEAAKKMSKECECTSYVNPKEHVIFFFILEPDKEI